MPKRAIWLTGLLITLVMTVLTALAPTPVQQLKNAVFDAYQRSAPRIADPSVPVHVIDIDEESLRLLGQWPWPRTFLAELTDRLFALGAVTVGFDILFTEPDRTSPAALVSNLMSSVSRL